MNDYQLTVKDVDDTRYDLEVIYKGKKYMKHITGAYLDTCIGIIKLYPNLLKDTLVKNKDDYKFFTLEVIKVNQDQLFLINFNQEQLKLSFTIDIQFAKEVVIIYLDLVGVVEDELTDMLRISTYELNDELMDEIASEEQNRIRHLIQQKKLNLQTGPHPRMENLNRVERRKISQLDSNKRNYWNSRGKGNLIVFVFIVEGHSDALKTVLDRSNDSNKYPIEMDNKLLFSDKDLDVEKFIMQINMESLFKNVATVYNLLKNK